MKEFVRREKTRSVRVGKITIGGNDHVVIQSMCNTKTRDVEATVAQIRELAAAGCELVRLAIFDMRDAEAVADIKKQVNIPLVADIHYD